MPIATAVIGAVLKRNFIPCLRDCLREIAFVTKKLITWPSLMRASDRPQFQVLKLNHVVLRRTDINAALGVNFGF